MQSVCLCVCVRAVEERLQREKAEEKKKYKMSKREEDGARASEMKRGSRRD